MTAAPESLATLERRAWLAGAGVGVVCAAWGALAPTQFFPSYLIGFLLWSGIALGSLALLMIHHLTGGAWGLVIRRVLEAAVATLPVLAGLFVPIALALPRLFVWADPAAMAEDATLADKAGFLNPLFFVARAATYFVVWVALARRLTRESDALERGDPGAAARIQTVSGVGLVLYGLTVTFAAVDWLMSLEPHWHSTVYGLLFAVGQTLSGLAFAIPVLVVLARRPPLAGVVARNHYHDLGNLLLALVMIWAYLGYSQYLITWSGNLPEQIPWYIVRTTGGWQVIGALLIGLHFVLPFSLLLLRTTKQRARTLAGVALLVLALRLVDLVWLVRPVFAPVLGLHPLDVLVPVALGGVWLGAFLRALAARPVWPVGVAPVADEAPSEVTP